MPKHIHIHLHRTRDDREPDQSDLNAAARGLNMLGMSPLDLADLMREYEGKQHVFASKAIYLAARQMRAQKIRQGARDGLSTEGGYGTGGRADEIESKVQKNGNTYQWLVRFKGGELLADGSAATREEAEAARDKNHNRIVRSWVRNGVVE